ncbi:MAG TPA: hypothetical protein VGC10_01400 [Sphingomonas sp.]
MRRNINAISWMIRQTAMVWPGIRVRLEQRAHRRMTLLAELGAQSVQAAIQAIECCVDIAVWIAAGSIDQGGRVRHHPVEDGPSRVSTTRP